VSTEPDEAANATAKGNDPTCTNVHILKAECALRLKVVKILASNNMKSITTLKCDDINESEMNRHELTSQFLEK
jgi:hypothetical protein